MSTTKGDISKNITLKTSITSIESKQILDSFIKEIIKNTSSKVVKISGFGSFFKRETPSRAGRNPKTGEEHQISKKNKLFMITSNKVKERIN